MNLNQITVPVLDLTASIEFYQTLGLQLIVEAMPHYARFACPEGGSTFSIHLVDEMPEGQRTIVYFEVAKLDEVVARLLEKGLQFDALPQDKSWLWREAELKDPDGNPIKLYFAGKNRLHPPWRIGNEKK